jgi:GntR family transcriptional regulator
MIIQIDFAAETSIYTQLKNQIVMGIAAGELAPGEALPSIRQLAGDIGINMHTVNKAYQQLKTEGYLVTHKRSGVIVNAPEKMVDPGFAQILDPVLRPLIAEAVCKGLSEAQLTDLCKTVYRHFNKGGQT